jgi:uncharacterized protein YqjF (DUF2071 family)
VDLAMVNYEIDPDVLRPLVPPGTELDAWCGRHLLSLVGFRFLGTRVRGLAVPWHEDFLEVNLRFYVRREAADGLRRGVVFVKEIVPRRAIAWIARRLYNENYVALPMRHSEEATPDGRRVSYGWRLGATWGGLSLVARGAPLLHPEDSEESFVTEHYWGYVRQRDGTTLEYQVEHPRWRVWRGDDARVETDVAALYGEAFVPVLAARPCSAFLAEGSPVVVRRGRLLPRP